MENTSNSHPAKVDHLSVRNVVRSILRLPYLVNSYDVLAKEKQYSCLGVNGQ